jgi:hypothetical protein
VFGGPHLGRQLDVAQPVHVALLSLREVNLQLRGHLVAADALHEVVDAHQEAAAADVLAGLLVHVLHRDAHAVARPVSQEVDRDRFVRGWKEQDVNII